MPLISYSWQFMLDQAFVDLASVRSVTSAILSFKEDSVQMGKMSKDILGCCFFLYKYIDRHFENYKSDKKQYI